MTLTGRIPTGVFGCFTIVIVLLAAVYVKNVDGLRHVQSLLDSQYRDWPESRERRQINTDALRNMFKAPCFGRVGFFEDPFSCSHYYHCMANGTHVRRTCIPPLQFSEERQMCMDPGTVDCPDIPDFWLAAAAAAAASNTAPSPPSPPAANNNPHSMPGPPHPSSPPAPSQNNPFVSSPLTFNAPLTQHQPQQAQFNTHHAQASQQHPHQSPWNNNQYSGAAPAMAFYDHNARPLGRASPADPHPVFQPAPPAPVAQAAPGQVQMRPLTAYGAPYSAPLRAGFIPQYGVPQANPNTPPVPVQTPDINQLWYRMEAPVDSVQPVAQALPAQRRYATPNALLDMQRLQSQQQSAPQPPSQQQHQQQQQINNAMNVLSLLNAQLGLDPQAPAVYAQPSISQPNQEVMRQPPPLQPYEPAYTVLNDATPLRVDYENAPGQPVTAAPTATLNRDVVSITCKPGEKGFFADMALLCRGYYFCSPFGDRAEFSCPFGRFFNEKTVSCESMDKSSCAELARDQHVPPVKPDSLDQLHPPPAVPAPTLTAQATAMHSHPAGNLMPHHDRPLTLPPAAASRLYQLTNPETPAPPTALAVDPTRSTLWRMPTAMQTTQSEVPVPFPTQPLPTGKGETKQELAPIDPLPMDFVGVMAPGIFPAADTHQTTDSTVPQLPTTFPTEPPPRHLDTVPPSALENKLRSWNMVNFSSHQPDTSPLTNAPPTLGVVVVETTGQKAEHPSANALKSVPLDDMLKEVQDKEATALSMALAFLRAREMFSTSPPRPLRFADSRRTVNLKLLAELLKG